MRRLALLVVAASALTAGAAGGAVATRECAGLPVCVPVVGPWVVVPTGAASVRPQTEFQLTCPRAFVVGGLDAELSVKEIDVSFDGQLGSPVNPGITTGRDAVFRATKTGRSPARVTFRPHIGCMPASGGRPRPPTAVRPSAPLALPLAAFPPGQATVRRARHVLLKPGREQRVARGCARGERLVGGWHAVGFYTEGPPSARLAATVTGARTIAAGRVSVTLNNDLRPGVQVVVQVVAICAGEQ